MKTTSALLFLILSIVSSYAEESSSTSPQEDGSYPMNLDLQKEFKIEDAKSSFGSSKVETSNEFQEKPIVVDSSFPMPSNFYEYDVPAMYPPVPAVPASMIPSDEPFVYRSGIPLPVFHSAKSFESNIPDEVFHSNVAFEHPVPLYHSSEPIAYEPVAPVHYGHYEPAIIHRYASTFETPVPSKSILSKVWSWHKSIKHPIVSAVKKLGSYFTKKHFKYGAAV
ncbi:uncharacterized protein LOC126896534 [Daktulosphaira vitifoliae]|uniref:uncharacterized protein LOC126896534 n=1 Tax=Daktulosphaira vitifoliae TaxID=58002 RepID=UPI0021A9B7EC|nr:uncharacterized protein LOC126896534 [Daktulosphaira vitifoliae]